MGSAFMWPLVCRPSCYPGYCQETRLRLGHEWQTIFIISNDTQKEIPFQASYLFQQPARTKAVNETSRNFTVPKRKDHNWEVNGSLLTKSPIISRWKVAGGWWGLLPTALWNSAFPVAISSQSPALLLPSFHGMVTQLQRVTREIFLWWIRKYKKRSLTNVT